MWKFRGKAQFPRSFGRFARNYAEAVPFHKNFVTRTLGYFILYRWTVRMFNNISANKRGIDLEFVTAEKYNRVNLD